MSVRKRARQQKGKTVRRLRVVQDQVFGVPVSVTAKKLHVAERSIYRDRADVETGKDQEARAYRDYLFTEYKRDCEQGLRKGLRGGSPAMVKAFLEGSGIWTSKIAVEHSGGITVEKADDIRANAILRVSSTKAGK
jgi:hypothetical protein